MTGDNPKDAIGHVVKAIAIILASATLTFMALGSKIFEPDYDEVKRAISNEVRDPASTQFRAIRGRGDTYCGEVNARNGFGAYTGFRPFVYRRGIVILEPQKRPGSPIAERSQYYEDLARFARLQQECHSQ